MLCIMIGETMSLETRADIDLESVTEYPYLACIETEAKAKKLEIMHVDSCPYRQKEE